MVMDHSIFDGEGLWQELAATHRVQCCLHAVHHVQGHLVQDGVYGFEASLCAVGRMHGISVD